MLLTVQYSINPEGKPQNITVKINGINSIIFICMLSVPGAVVGVIFSEIYHDAPIASGRILNGIPIPGISKRSSGAERSFIHRNELCLSSIEYSRTSYRAMK